MKLDNKNILVTGANRDIGAAIVRELLKHKVGKVYVSARKPGGLSDFGDKRVAHIALDITDRNQVSAAANVAQDTHILINNAGTLNAVGIIDGALEAITSDMNTNYYGTLAMMQAFAPVLQKNRPGLIANVISLVGLAPVLVIGGYSASKAALHSATQSARGELAKRGIRVVGIYPGPIDTDMARGFEMDKTSPQATAQAIIAGIIADDDYIFPDSMSKDIGQKWLQDPVGIEKQFASMFAEGE